MTFEDTEARIRHLEVEVLRLRTRLARTSVGPAINLTLPAGILPMASGGTSSDAGPLLVAPKFRNDTGGSLAEGTVVVLDSAGARDVKTTAAVASLLALGVVSGPGAPYANLAETPVLTLGYHAALLVAGAVSIGAYLATSTTAGRASSLGASPGPGAFAIALSSFAGPGNGAVQAYVFPVITSIQQARFYVPFGSQAAEGQAFAP